ncbi:MAG: hypothetical protein NC818_07120 [Candidatus Omnitrophica bacterium]|nr:hypothetical protein [Candidatus Omnitrophota bacterium]
MAIQSIPKERKRKTKPLTKENILVKILGERLKPRKEIILIKKNIKIHKYKNLIPIINACAKLMEKFFSFSSVKSRRN